MTRRFLSYDPVDSGRARFGVQATVTPTSFAAMDAIKAMGGDLVRVQLAWPNVENYYTGDLDIPQAWKDVLDYCGEIDLSPIMVAGYGPPYAQLMTVTLAQPLTVGQKTIVVNENISSIDPPFCHIHGGIDGIVGINTFRWAYYGALIHSVNSVTKTITLAADAREALPIGSVLSVYRLRYATLATQSPTEPGALAFIRMAKYLAQEIYDRAGKGYVGLWNEPPWIHDSWNSRGWFYIDYPSFGTTNIPVGIELDGSITSLRKAALNVDDLPPTVRFINEAANKTGFASILGLSPQPTLSQIKSSVSVEAAHPYGALPENINYYLDEYDPLYLTPWLRILNTYNQGANFAWMQGMQQIFAEANDDYEIYNIATECGSYIPNDERQAAYLLRRVCSLWGMKWGVVIYALRDGSTFDLTTGSGETFTPRPSYTALSRLVHIKNSVGESGGPPRSVPIVIGAEDGEFPLLSCGIYGKDGGVLFIWMRTYGPSASAIWEYAPPVASTIETQIQVPSGYEIVECKNVLTNANVDYTTVGRITTLEIGEAVIAIRTEKT